MQMTPFQSFKDTAMVLRQAEWKSRAQDCEWAVGEIERLRSVIQSVADAAMHGLRHDETEALSAINNLCRSTLKD